MEDKVAVTQDQADDLNVVASFLACRDVERLDRQELKRRYGLNQAGLLILLGNSIPYVAEQAARAYKEGLAARLMIAGGEGHSTEYLRENIRNHPRYRSVEVEGRPEADILLDILAGYLGIERGDVLLENRSTNCGANAREALRVLRARVHQLRCFCAGCQE